MNGVIELSKYVCFIFVLLFNVLFFDCELCIEL